MSFGSRLKERREYLGLKQSELGKMLGVTASAIGNYENEVSSPKASILYKVFDALKCDANFLFQDEMVEWKAKSTQDARDDILLSLFHKLNDEGQEKLLDSADDLVQSRKYIKKTNAPELVQKELREVKHGTNG